MRNKAKRTVVFIETKKGAYSSLLISEEDLSYVPRAFDLVALIS